MEQLFAVRVLVHYYDKPKVDHAAVRRLLSAAAVNQLQLLLSEGTTTTLSVYIDTPPLNRKSISDVVDSCGTSLVQVASVFMLAEARAAADEICTSPNELETACLALERLLSCLFTSRHQIPFHDINLTGHDKLGSGIRRRTLNSIFSSSSRPSPSSSSSSSSETHASILKAVNAVLRLCDVATHCLAVVARQTVSPLTTCQVAVNLSTRLLTLAASLHEAQREYSNPSPALSFFSSNSLRTALVSGALHLGAITIEHLSIDPMDWIYIANRIATTNVTSVPQRTSVMSALFGGMIRSGMAYESCERDMKAAERALCLLSTLHVVLETDVSREIRTCDSERTHSHLKPPSKPTSQDSNTSTPGSGTISQAARSFLGERVVSAEEDGDEGRIAARTVYQACEEYAQRSGETEGVIGLLSKLFEVAARHCRQETAEETVVSLSDSALNLSCPPDESDASSDGPHARSDGTPFHVDIFDQRMRDGFGIITTVTSTAEENIEISERLEFHRQIGSLALDMLAHWIHNPNVIQRVAELDVIEFSVRMCKNACFFTTGESSASYDLLSSMSEFGALLCPVIEKRITELHLEKSSTKRMDFVSALLKSCQNLNPIVSNVLRSLLNDDVIMLLLKHFLEPESGVGTNSDDSQGLPKESILQLLHSSISRDNCILVLRRIVEHLNQKDDSDFEDVDALNNCAACFNLLSYTVYVSLGLHAKVSHLIRQSLGGLNRPDGSSLNMDYREHIKYLETVIQQSNEVCKEKDIQSLFQLVSNVPAIMRKYCLDSKLIFSLSPSSFQLRKPHLSFDSDSDLFEFKKPKASYNLMWSFAITHFALSAVEIASGSKFQSTVTEDNDKDILSSTCMFAQQQVCESASRTQLLYLLKQNLQSPLTMMYIAESLALLQLQSNRSTNSTDISLLLKTLVRSSADLLSRSISDDLAGYTTRLQDTFQMESTFGELSKSGDSTGILSFQKSKGGPLNLSSVELGMDYVRKSRFGKLSEVFCHALLSATTLLDHMSAEDVTSARDIVFDVLKVLPFVPESFEDLPRAIIHFVKKYLRLAFPNYELPEKELNDVINFMTRVSSFSCLSERASSCPADIQTFCKFISEIARDENVDINALESCMRPQMATDKFGPISKWLKVSLPHGSLKEIVSTLLISQDESGVIVSCLANALTWLREGCDESNIWCIGVLDSLDQLLSLEDSQFPNAMIRGPIMRFTSMQDAVIPLLERVIGSSDDGKGLKVLLRCFSSVQSIIEDEESQSFEYLIRLINFAVYITIMCGKICVYRGEESSNILEGELFSLLIRFLKKTANLMYETEEESWKQAVLYLCLLLDAIHSGLSGDHSSVFDRVNIPGKENSTKSSVIEEDSDIKKSDIATENQSRNISGSPSSFSSTASENSRASKLCTYTTTGDQYVEQHWYFCYTCDLAGSDGVCSICARTCHKGCELAYSKFSRFFCDCGHGAVTENEGSGITTSSEERSASNSQASSVSKSRSGKTRKPCISLKHRSPTESKSKVVSNVPKIRSSFDPSQLYEREILAGSELRQRICEELKAAREEGADSGKKRFAIIQKLFSEMFKDKSTLNCLLNVALFFIKDLEIGQQETPAICKWMNVDAVLSYSKKLFEDPSFEKSTSNGKKLKTCKVLNSGSFDTLSPSLEKNSTPPWGSFITYSPFHTVAAISNKSGSIEFVDMSKALVSLESIFEKRESPLGKISSSPVAKHVCFHPENPNIILASNETQVFVYYREAIGTASGWKHVEIEVGLTEFEGSETLNNLVSVKWVEGEVSLLLVTSESFVKIFDVAVDTFCPCFYAKIPEAQVEKNANVVNEKEEKEEQEKLVEVDDSPLRNIVSTCVIRNRVTELSERDFAVLLLTSDGALFLARTKTNESTSPLFKFCFNVSFNKEADTPENSNTIEMSYVPQQSSLSVVYSDGSVLLMSLALKFNEKDIELGLNFAHFYKEALPSGKAIEIAPLPESTTKFFFFQKASSLSNCGILSLSPNQDVDVNYLGGSSSSSVLGLSTFSASSIVGGPVENGAFVLLDDGSIHRVYASENNNNRQTAQVLLYPDILTRRCQRGLPREQDISDNEDSYGPIPDPIGFFEKSRPLSDNITYESYNGIDDEGINFERMSGVLSSEGGESVLSPRENQPFRFSVSVNNKSLVVVGVRLRVGGTERSRNRVPSEIKVFGRTIKPLPKNGLKRWIDIPFTVLESMNSPQRVTFELVPRRSTIETQTATDGLTALDCLELHAVSDVDFTERKLTFETEKANHTELLKQKQENKKEESCCPFLNISTALEDVQFTQEQATILAVVEFMKTQPVPLSTESGRLLFDVNNLWSVPLHDLSNAASAFLQHLTRKCLQLLRTSSDTKIVNHQSSDIFLQRLSLFAEGSKLAVKKEVLNPVKAGFYPPISGMEKCLFSLSCLSRSLLRVGYVNSFRIEDWCRNFDIIMPPRLDVFSLLRWNLALGQRGRHMYRSLKGTYIGLVDITLLHCIRERFSKTEKNLFTPILVEMLCGHDQYLRLATGQRLLELLDSADGTTNFTGSPLEINGISEDFNNSLSAEEPTNTSGVPYSTEDPDGSQNWAYRCDSCGEVCEEEWWHCNDCEDFDLCTNCLRSSDIITETHKEDHILLRGTPEDDCDQNDINFEDNLDELIIGVQETIKVLVNEILNQMDNCPIPQKWRFLDAAEIIAQLLNAQSPVEFRKLRLASLWKSSYPQALKKEIEDITQELNSTKISPHTLLSPSFSSPGSTVGFLLFMRILLCSKGSIMPLHMHMHGIPSLLVGLLTGLHEKLQASHPTCDRNDQSSERRWPHNFMDEGIWNENISELTYQLLSPDTDSINSKTNSDSQYLTNKINNSGNTFLCILLEVLRVLDYAYRFASSSLITKEMNEIPRNVLCDIINFSQTTSSQFENSAMMIEIGSKASQLLSTLSFDKNDILNDILDKYLYEEQAKRLRKSFTDMVILEGLTSYKSSLEIAEVVENLHKAAHRHPATWRKFANQKEGVIEDIFAVCKLLDGDIQVRALQLLAAALSVSSELSSRAIRGLAVSDLDVIADGNSKTDGSSESRSTDIESAELKECWTVSALTRAGHDQESDLEKLMSSNQFEKINYLISWVMLKSQSAAARRAASQIVVFCLAYCSKNEDASDFLMALDNNLLNGLELMQFSGEIADGLMHCLRFFIACCQENLFGSSSAKLLTSTTVKIMDLLTSRCSALVSHPNARFYCRLSEIVDLSGYYLETDPCLACSTATWEAAGQHDFRLDMVRAETKYTDCSIMHRLISPHEIHGISLKVVDPRRTRRVKKIDIYYSMRSVSDAADLKSDAHPWKRLKSLYLGPNSNEASVDLAVPVAIANIKLVFAEFHNFTSSTAESGADSQGLANSSSSTSSRRSGNGRTSENLQCPRCSRTVTNRYGICRNCHENAYQCRQCRNINYENLDGFLCNECGYCKHGRFEFSVNGRATHVAESIRNEEDRKRASKIIEKETNNVHRCLEQLIRIRSSMIKSLVSGVLGDETTQRSKSFIGSRIALADLIDSISPRPEIAVLEALLEGQVGQEIDESSHGGQAIHATEEVLAEGSSTDAHERDHSHRSGSNVASPVNRSSRSEAQQKIPSNDTTGFNKITSAIATTYSKECKTIFATLCRGICVLTKTRSELVRYANHVGGNRLFDLSEDSESSDDDNIPTGSQSGRKDTHKNSKSSSCCYRCTQSFIAKSLQLLELILRRTGQSANLIKTSTLAKSMMQVCSLCEKREIQNDIRKVLTLMVNNNLHSTKLVCKELERKIGFCIESFETVDAHSIARFEMGILESTAVLDDSCWEERLKLVVRILFRASTEALTCSSVAESIILPCLRVALTLSRSDSELTVIETCSPEDDTADAPVSVTGSGENEESVKSDNDADDTSENATHILQESVDIDITPQLNLLQSNLPDVFGHILNDNNAAANVSAASPPDPQEIQQENEQRSQQDQASEQIISSRTPSSIDTTCDENIPDEVESSQGGPESNINLTQIQSVMKKIHDGKRLSANISKWLEGKQTHSTWIAEMGERTHQLESMDKSSVSSRSTAATNPSVGTIFREWKKFNSSQNEEQGGDGINLFSNILSISKNNWIIRLMLFTPCTAVRKEACALLELICGQEEMLQLQLLDLLSGPSLSLGANVGEKSKEFFDLLESSISSRNHRLYLIGKGFLPHLASLILSKAERLIQLEFEADVSIRVVNFMEGYSLKRLVSLMRHALGVVPSKRPSLREKLLECDDNKIVKCLQRAYLYVRKLISLKTRLTDECATQLGEILLSKDYLFAGSTVTPIVSACVMELKNANHRNDAQGGAILLDELCQMLCPERKEPTCLLTLNKTPTQEEFIRGSMSRNPYSSSSFDGPLMRDVKNKICKDLDLPGLLEDDFAMELLVAGNVVKLDLPIMSVYEHVWRGAAAAQAAANAQTTHVSRTLGIRRGRVRGISRSEGTARGNLIHIRHINSEREDSEDGSASRSSDSRVEPPMVIVYRLSGLDGEATEPIIDSLPESKDEEESNEELYRDTVVLGNVGGFDVLFQLLAVVGSWGDDAETAVRAPALRLLRASCEVTQNRAMLAKSRNAVSTLLDCAASAYEHAQGSPAAVASAESLLIAAEKILAQQRRDMDNDPNALIKQDAVDLNSDDPEEVTSRVEVFLGRLEKATSPTAEYSILHLIPFLIQGLKSAIDLVLKYFSFSNDYFDFSNDDQRKAKQLGTVLSATPKDQRGNAFISQIIKSGIADKAVDYIVSKFRLPKKENLQMWDDALEEHGVPLILKLLTGLSSFLDFEEGAESGKLLKEIILKRKEVIPVLSQLEMAVSDNSVGTCAEELLEGLSRDIEIEMEVNKERQAIKRARREAALASRAAILKESGLSPFAGAGEPSPSNVTKNTSDSADENKTGKPKEVVADSVFAMMEDLDDEVGPACVVCGDGFRCRPEEALTMYVYCKKMPLELSPKNGAWENGSNSSAKNGNGEEANNRMNWETWTSGRPRANSSGTGGSNISNGNSNIVSTISTNNNNSNGSKSSAGNCFSSVTHLNAIHVGCHREAARMDRSSRRDEWDGAALRNSQTKCNNMYPVRPPMTLWTEQEREKQNHATSAYEQAVTSYTTAVDSYFSRLNGVGRVNLSMLKIVIYDLGRCLLRFADGGTAVFSEHSKGGGAHSNACLIPHMVQLSLYLMQNGGQSGMNKGNKKQVATSSTVNGGARSKEKGEEVGVVEKSLSTQKAALEKYVAEDEVGDLTYYLGLSIVLNNMKEWKQNVSKFLRRAVKDGVLGKGQSLRLIGFADLVSSTLKQGMSEDLPGGDVAWLNAFATHIGKDETFNGKAGDVLNEEWENRLRKVEQKEQFLEVMRRHLEITECTSSVGEWEQFQRDIVQMIE